MSSLRIDELEGVGPVYADKLRTIGIETTVELLEAASTPEGRRELSRRTDVPERRLLGWVQLVDLCRIDGLDPGCAQLLGLSGVQTVAELAEHDPTTLAKRCAELNEMRPIVRRPPTQRLPSQG